MYSIIITGVGLGLFMYISVGPTIFAIIKYSISYGWRAGISFVVGVSVSDILYISLANLASGMLLGLLYYKNMIGYVGSILFIMMGLHGFLKKIKVTRSRTDNANVKSKDYWKIAASGFLLNTFNPGVIITWLTAVAAVTNIQYDNLLQNSIISPTFLFFASCLSVILGFDILKVFLAQIIRKKLTPRNIIYLNRISALCILGIGLFLFLKVFFDIKLGNF